MIEPRLAALSAAWLVTAGPGLAQELPAFPAAKATCRIRGRIRADKPIPMWKFELPKGEADKLTDDVLEESRLCHRETLALPNVVVHVRALEDRWKFEVPKRVTKLSIVPGRFDPHVVALMSGQKLRIENKLSELVAVVVGCKTYSDTCEIESNRGRELQVRGSTNGRGAVVVPVRPWLLARLHVFLHPIFAVSSPSGAFRLPPLPPGEYELEAHHELLGTQRKRIKVEAGHRAKVDFVFQVDGRYLVAKKRGRHNRGFASAMRAELDAVTRVMAAQVAQLAAQGKPAQGKRQREALRRRVAMLRTRLVQIVERIRGQMLVPIER